MYNAREGKEEGDDLMAIRQEELKNKSIAERNAVIKSLVNKIADCNDEALRKLSKN